MCTWNITLCDGEMRVLLLCVWKLAFVKSSHNVSIYVCMSVCNYECMYVHILSLSAHGFIIDFSSGIYMSLFCILHTRLFRPRHSHKPCFYTDKIQHIIYTHKCIYMFMYVYIHYNIREAIYKEYTHISAILVTNLSSQHILAICQLWIEQSQSTLLW